MEFILDIIFVAMAVAMILLGAKKGLVKALLDGLSTIISGVIAYILSEPVAKFIYDAFVRSVVKGELEKGLEESGTDFGSVSESVNGSRYILHVCLLNSPPLFSLRLLVIHAVADPQTMKTMSLREDAQSFQKNSKASRNPEFLVSSHGISSKKTILRSEIAVFPRYSLRYSNACTQSDGISLNSPVLRLNSAVKFLN
jgi:hypothetical protein